MGLGGDLWRFAVRRKEHLNEIASAVVLRGANQMVLQSPVDKGFLKNNWNSSIGDISYKIDAPENPNGTNSLSGIAKTFSVFGTGKVGYFTNSMPYAMRIEYDGWSQQAPSGVVRVNVRKMRRYLREEVNLRK